MPKLTRRSFVRSTAAMAAAATLSRAVAADKPQAPVAPIAGLGGGDIRLGVIGCGERGQSDLQKFLRFAQVKVPAVCDVDDARSAEAVKVVTATGRPAPGATKDFRQLLSLKDIDIVLIATPDHWHALPTVEACKAGKGVYVEKPLATTIAEGRAMIEAARKYNCTVQMGTQWRSHPQIQAAIAYVHSGKLGKIRQVRTWCDLSWIKSVGKPPDGQPPATADYNFWLGPAPKRTFNPARFHFNFRWFWDYGGGLMTDWGVHLINLALWGMKADAPTRISAHGGKYAFDDISETPDTQCAVYDFRRGPAGSGINENMPNDFLLTWEHQAQSGLSPENHYYGAAFYGENGKLIVNADFWEVIPEKKKDLKAERHDCERGEGNMEHVRNFLECVAARKQPVTDVAIGHRATTTAHLGNLALLTGRSLKWDAEKEQIIGDDEANKLLTREYRAPWEFPKA